MNKIIFILCLLIAPGLFAATGSGFGGGGTGTSTITDLGDATADGTVDLTGYKITWTSTLNTAGSVYTFTNTTSDLTADVSFMDFKYTDDGDANGYFLRGYDNVSDLLWYVGVGGLARFPYLNTDSISITNAGIIKPAASTDGHTFIIQAYGTDGSNNPELKNVITCTNDTAATANNLPECSIDNVELSLPTLAFDATPNGMSDDTKNGQVIKGLNSGEAITQWDCVYLDPTETEWMTSDNTSLNTTVSPDRPKRCEGLALATGSNGAELIVVVKGVVRNDGWNWTADLPVYLTTSGDLTQTVPTTASGFKQEVGIATTDDEIYVDPKPIDWGITRTSADADGRTLNCIEATGTIWMATGAGTFTLPAVSECPTLNGAVITVGAVAIILDVNASDRQVQDGIANADGDSSTNTSTAGDMITYGYYDADGPWTQTNGWTAN